MNAAGITVLLALGCVCVSCAEGARALIPINVMARSSDDVSGVALVRISASKDSQEVAAHNFTWSSSMPSPTFGLYVSGDVTGEVTITAMGMSGSGLEVAGSLDVGRTQVVPGRIAPAVTLILQRLSDSSFDGGADAASGPSDGTLALPDTAAPADASGLGDGGRPAPEWSPYEDVRKDGRGNSSMPSVAIDPTSSTGDAVILFAESNKVRAVRRIGGNWNSAFETLYTGAKTLYPRVRFDRRGCAMAVWIEAAEKVSAHPQGVYAARSCSLGAWSTPTLVYSGPINEYPDLAVASSGLSRVVWTEMVGDEPLRNLVQTAFYDGTDWHSPISLSFFGSDNRTRRPRVVISDSGRGYIAFNLRAGEGRLQTVPFAGQNVEIGKTSYNVDDSSTLQADADDAGAIAMNRAGKAMVVWIHDAGSSHQVMARQHDGAGGWSNPVSLGSATRLYRPDVVVAPDGSVVVGWTQAKDPNKQDILAQQDFLFSRYSRDGLEWNQEALTHDYLIGRDGKNSSPLFGADDQGLVHIVWNRTYAGGSGALNAVWLGGGKPAALPRVLVNSPDAYPAERDLAVAPGGQAILTWVLRDTSSFAPSTIWISEFP